MEDVCRNIGLDGEKIIGWVSFSQNWEYHRLKPYLQENAQIMTKKLE